MNSIHSVVLTVLLAFLFPTLSESATQKKKAMPAQADPGAGLTSGIIDLNQQSCPAGARQLVGKTGYNLVPESDAKCLWTFKDGVLTASPAWDSVVTREPYRDFRMHLEFNVNHVHNVEDPEKDGNSGIYIQQRYEIQILNSYGVSEEDYKASYCGSLYRLRKPDRLANKPAGQWQRFDIVFRAARFDGNTKLENARITVYQNQQLIHDDVSIPRKTGAGQKEGPEPRPIKLQGHHNPVRFRNVWIQPLDLAQKAAANEKPVYPGADERTPSYSQYFSWINNTNEGSTEAQTLANLDFFKWLNHEYGMVLDIYVISAGAIDKAGRYGKMDSDAFRRQFPNGFGPIHEKAKSMGTRLGTWGGPDGFGNTPAEEQARIDMMVKLCRDYEFILLKFDGVVGPLRPEKQDAFVRMMTECRKYSPDLILLNHRLKLGKGLPHATTYLLGGAETYIDVHMCNNQTAPHHRAGAISRRVVPELVRLTEDHGVCISSCLDYWEDDLILQAFNRGLILAPQLYGNPWFLRDDEYPKLARIFSLARQYRDIMVDGMVLPEDRYGEKAVVRGDGRTRLLTLRNLGWEPITCQVRLDEEIGLRQGTTVELRQYHPTERVIGTFAKGAAVEVEVLPFRSCLLLATTAQAGLGIMGCDYQVVRDVPGKPVQIRLLALPGETRDIELTGAHRQFKSARIDKRRVDGLVQGQGQTIPFPGVPLQERHHRKLGDLLPCPVPADAEALYEATCFAANNNALELRALQRSGPSRIPQVVKARQAFLQQPLFTERGLWDRNLFDGNDETAFYVARRVGMAPLSGGSLRIDLAKAISLDTLIIRTGSEHALQPFKYDETIRAQVSSDLKHWTPISLVANKTVTMNLDPKTRLRYIRFNGTPDRIVEIEGYLKGEKLVRSQWRASQLFARYSRVRASKAWQHSFTLDEIPPGSYLAIALNGEHGLEGAYAAIRVNGKPVGAPDRSVSYPANTWEYPARRRSSNYTYYVPLTPDMKGATIDAVVLGLRHGVDKFKPEVWITAYPAPFSQRLLTLSEK